MRKLAIAAAVSSSLATFSVNSLALGLGDIEMYSALNQTLDAEINILSATPAELASAQVRIAPAAAFASAGIDRTPLLTSMKFNIERRADGSPIVKITSDAPVIEPFLNFLVEIDSDGSGRQVREFTVLLDPPVFTTQRTQLPEATVAESQVVNIEEEVGASSPIIRSDIVVDNDAVVDEVEIVVTTENVQAVEIEDGEYIDLSKEIEASDNVFETVDLSIAESVVTDEAPLVTDLRTVTTEGEVITTSDESELFTSVDLTPVIESAAEDGELIPLDIALLNSNSNSSAAAVVLDSDAVEDAGEVVELDDLGTSGQPIFDSETGSTDQISASDGRVSEDELDQGARVDLTDLLPVELVREGSPADLEETTEGVGISLDGVLPLAEEPVSETEIPVTEQLEADVVAVETSVPDGNLAEVVDLSGLQTTENPAAGQAEVFVDAEVIVDSEIVVGSSETVAESATLDTDAASEGLGVAIDLSGILEEGAGTASDAVAGGDTITVNSDDTLWSIAEDNKPAGVTTQQMMVALLERNQNAFLNGDMNQMLVGSVLEMPAAAASSAIARVDALAMVREQTEFSGRSSSQPIETLPEQVAIEDPAPEAVAGTSEDISNLPIATPVDAEIATVESEASEESPGLTIVGVDETAIGVGTPSTDELNPGTDLSRDLDDVNRRVQLAQEELASETMQRDELQGRVDDLTSSMTKMKRLITLRESELSSLQTELTEADTDATDIAGAAETEATSEAVASEQSGEPAEETQARIREMQEKISDEATLAQDRVAAQADADKNLASAEAEAQRIRLANEEDELKLQLATLRAEKAALEETSQLEKAELVRAAEEEKSALLEQAQAEKERIQARLEEEKARITAEAEEEKLAIAEQASQENERLIAEANAERERLAAESNEMRLQLQALEEEKNQLLAQAEIDKQQLQESTDENLRLQAEAEAERQRADDEARIRERLAEEQANAAANLEASNTQNIVERSPAAQTDTDAAAVETDADTVVDEATDGVNNLAGKIGDVTGDLAGKGAAAAGTFGALMSYAPLQKVVGDRTKTLAAGGGIALLGLLASWGLRRRNRVVKEDINIDDGELRDSLDVDEIGRDPSNNFERTGSAPRRSDSRMKTAAAATAAAAAVRGGDTAQPDSTDANAAATSLEAARNDSGIQDDTLTEAEVYLRYGLHGQAEELLSSAIERDPDNQDYHVKLLENYHDQKNANGFRSAAAEFQDRFGPSQHWDRIAEMGRDLDPGDSMFSRASAMDISSAATGVVAGVAATGAAVVAGSSNDSQVTGKDSTADSVSDIDELADDFLLDDVADVDLDDTIDPGAEFDLSELQATGQFDSSTEPTSLEDVTLDEIDLAALDDDGTLNLEEVAGEEMSGLDLGALDFGDADGDNSLDNLTLDDANLNSLDDMTSSLRGGLESDQGVDDLDTGLNSRVDEMETMLDLAKAYIDMGDNSSAIGPLKDIAANGSPAQQSEATDLLKKIN